jgi:hypothetical protein
MKNKVLFILKRREDYNPEKHNPKGLSTGLYNSAMFMVDMLLNSGIDTHIEVAVDNNCIDRLVTKHRPTHVIIEALWVVPEKFYVLSKLHPTVQWIVRLHSETPFIAGEGIAMDWVGDYLDLSKVVIAVNAPRIFTELKTFAKAKRYWYESELNKKIIYLPNFYPNNYKIKKHQLDKYWVDVACFGAVRPLKNHLLQAHAALKFAKSVGKQLRFHINGGRIEGKGDAVMSNLRAMFEHLSDSQHQLIIHEWAPREEFLEICASMDIGLQCSLSETFNIVSADLISQGVPVVGSKEIPWACRLFNADPTDSGNIAKMMRRAHNYPKFNVYRNQHNLDKYTSVTKSLWLKYFKDSDNEG